MIFAIILCLSGIAFGGEIVAEFRYNPADFTLICDANGQHIKCADCVPVGEAGSPELIAQAVHILLPPHTRAKAIRVLTAEYAPLADDVLIAPFQPPVIRPTPGYDTSPMKVPKNEQIYAQDIFMPTQPLQSQSPKVGNLSGYSLAGFLIYPVRYNPARSKLDYLKSLVVSVEYYDSQVLMPMRQSPRRSAMFRRIVGKLVQNPEAMEQYATLSTIDVGAKDYAIVCPEGYLSTSEMDEFRLSLRRQGWNDTVLTNEAASSFPGDDDAERLRNAIKDLYETTGIAGVALVGDIFVVPFRYAFAMDCEAGFYPDENNIPCDLYFSDLDGNWNADGVWPYGEVEDSVDLYPDVIVGRISVESASEFSDWFEKYRRYVEEPPSDFGAEALFLAEILWTDPYTDSGVGKDMVRDNALLSYFSLTRLYESLGNENLTSVTSALNSGYNIVNHDGHAWYSVLGVGAGDYFGIGNADGLYNFPRCGVIYSIGCWPAAFDYDCIAEHFITNPNGGFVTFIGNSRYGWGSPGNPGYGYSDYFDITFWENVFSGTPSAGEALTLAKAQYAPFAQWENVWRWKEYVINILGEPGMIIWQNEPVAQEHELPATINDCGIPLTITSSGSFSATAIQDGEIIDRAYSSAGSADLWLAPITSSPVEIAVYDQAGLKKMFVDTIYIDTDRPYLALDWISHNVVSPSESISVDFHIRNYSSSSGGAFSWNPIALFGGSIIPMGTAPDSISPSDTFTLTALLVSDAELSFGDEVMLNLNCVCGSDTFPIAVNISVISPILAVNSLRLIGAEVGNAALPGESYAMFPQIVNLGNVDYNDDVDVSSLSSYVSVSGIMPVNAYIGTSYTSSSLDLSVASDCPSPSVQPILFSFADGTADTFYLSVGQGQFFDDAEETSRFSMDSPWHQTSDNSHDGTQSYRCAEASGFYPNDAYATMTSDAFIIGEDAQLSFWMRYEVTTYGTDGIYIYVYDVPADSLIQLDYIGSGGALPVLGFQVDWTRWRYPLQLPPGTEVQLKFVFTSDAEDTAGGFFVDDISTNWQLTSVDTTTNIRNQEKKPATIKLTAYPNPFNSSCRITLLERGPVMVEIYDLRGNVVFRIGEIAGAGDSCEYAEIAGQSLNGLRTFIWTPDEKISSGMYLVRVIEPTATTVGTKRILYLK